ALLGRAARRVALDDVELALLGFLAGAVRQLPGEVSRVERRLPPREFARLPRRLARSRGEGALFDHAARDGWRFLDELAQRLAHHGLDEPADLAVSQLGLGLPFELGLRELHADDRGEPLAHVLAG